MKNQKIWQSNNWIEYVDYYFNQYRRQSKAIFQEEDWKDIKQNIFLRIWNKRDLYKNNRPLKPWLKTVVRNTIKNEIRNIIALPTKNKRDRLFKLKFYYPNSIQKYQRAVNFSGEEYYYQPDPIDPRSEFREQIKYNELRPFLTLKEQKILRARIKGKTIKEIAKTNRSKISTIYGKLNIIRKKYKNIL